ncbi:MarR family transcriptional regulator [Agromyces fucosus]|uniref:MarR family transcriptional regulator n=1 Tax=Agromyces fucosus TaxID=41985 RepID=A0A4Q2JLJ7_9MICO|nr:MarR family transcriptional regulator [Agromyces fucosus]RXZ49041.1 MarR family transcriptional regulator [Agromyces fucosus]
MRRSERKAASPDLGILANRALHTVQRELFRTLAEQGHPDLRPRHGAVMAFIDEEGSRATDLAQQSGQHKQVIGTLVDELAALGYVRREPDPDDRRAKLVVPTERGLDQMQRSDAIVAEIEARHAEAAGDAAYDAFKRLLRQVGEAPSADGDAGVTP